MIYTPFLPDRGYLSVLLAKQSGQRNSQQHVNTEKQTKIQQIPSVLLLPMPIRLARKSVLCWRNETPTTVSRLSVDLQQQPPSQLFYFLCTASLLRRRNSVSPLLCALISRNFDSSVSLAFSSMPLKGLIHWLILDTRRPANRDGPIGLKLNGKRDGLSETGNDQTGILSGFHAVRLPRQPD